MEKFLRFLAGALVLLSVTLTFYAADRRVPMFLAAGVGLDILQSAFTRSGVLIYFVDKVLHEATPNERIHLVYRAISGSVILLGVCLFLWTDVLWGPIRSFWFLIVLAAVNIQSSVTNKCPLMYILSILLRERQREPSRAAL